MRTIRSRSIRASLVLAALVGVAGGLAACTPSVDCNAIKSQYADVPASNLTVDNAEKAVFCLTNDQRVARGLPAYTRSASLGQAARNHANDAVTRKWWVNGADPHTNPDGQGPGERARAAGYCPSGSAQVHENVYWGWGSPSGPTPRAAVTWWMNSPGHQANILHSGLKQIGLGVAKGAPQPGSFSNAAVFVQKFAICR
jgi:uncharacterized protein YkwD